MVRAGLEGLPWALRCGHDEFSGTTNVLDPRDYDGATSRLQKVQMYVTEHVDADPEGDMEIFGEMHCLANKTGQTLAASIIKHVTELIPMYQEAVEEVRKVKGSAWTARLTLVFCSDNLDTNFVGARVALPQLRIKLRRVGVELNVWLQFNSSGSAYLQSSHWRYAAPR